MMFPVYCFTEGPFRVVPFIAGINAMMPAATGLYVWLAETHAKNMPITSVLHKYDDLGVWREPDEKNLRKQQGNHKRLLIGSLLANWYNLSHWVLFRWSILPHLRGGSSLILLCHMTL
jgi:hypothetical protein